MRLQFYFSQNISNPPTSFTYRYSHSPAVLAIRSSTRFNHGSESVEIRWKARGNLAGWSTLTHGTVKNTHPVVYFLIQIYFLINRVLCVCVCLCLFCAHYFAYKLRFICVMFILFFSCSGCTLRFVICDRF